jgi:hypothetical protein
MLIGLDTRALVGKEGREHPRLSEQLLQRLWEKLAAVTGLQTWLWISLIDTGVVALPRDFAKFFVPFKYWNGTGWLSLFDQPDHRQNDVKFKCSLLGKSIWHIGNQPHVLKGVYWCSLAVWHTIHLRQMFLGTLLMCKNVTVGEEVWKKAC